LADDIWVRAEAVLPQMLAENYNLGIRRFFISQSKHAAVAGLDAKGVEIARRYHGTIDLDGFVSSSEIEKRISDRPGAVVFKGLVLRAIVQEIRGRNGSVLAEGTIAPAPHQPGSVFERQWT
jgi:hypothetical protein